MNICHDCGWTGEHHELRGYTEMHGFYYGNGEYIPLCPDCKSAEIGGAAECAECGEFAPEEKIIHGLCPACGAAEDFSLKIFKEGKSEAQWNYCLARLEDGYMTWG
jgi:predicted RNA-binding Zn-ribbon protein involved in translation (DUF1610 family)